MTGAAGSRGEAGFALVAALNATLLFSLFAYAVLAADRGAIAGVDADLRRARLEAAADAGLATAADGLSAPFNRRWPIDGRPRRLTLDGMALEIVVEDERGKAPLADLKPDAARRLFQAAGLSGTRLSQLTDGLLDWQDGGRRPDGPSDLDYVQAGLRPRGQPMHTVDELMALKGMDQTVYGQIAPALTVFFGARAGFDPATASPLAVQVMGAGRTSTPGAGDDYAGRPFTVRVTARDGADGAFHRTEIIELTGQKARPYWVRAAD